jgi:hypothetical protein
MFKFAHLILGAGLMFGASAASAGDLMPDSADGIMNACRADFHRMCSYVAPGEGRAARCLLEHKAELTPPCLSAIKIATDVEACTADYQRFCPGVPAGPNAFRCLADKMDALVPACRRVVSANLPYMLPGGERRYGYNRGQGAYGEPNPYAYRGGSPDDERDAGQGAPYGQPYSQPYSQPYGQTYGRPYSQPYNQPYGQTYGRPYSQPYGQPYSQPYGQPNSSEAYRDPGDGERYAEEGGTPRFRPYDDRYGSYGYATPGYDNAAPREPAEPEEEREPNR